MKKNYGDIIPGLEIDGIPAPYPVVNERAIRTTAGIMFVIGFSTMAYTLATNDYQLLSIVVPIFWLDFFLKSVFSPSWSLFDYIGKKIVSKQRPEYVGAIQKRFAWSLGLIMASIMLILSHFLQLRGIVPLMICVTCLTLMWFESAAGICIGCRIYSFLMKKGYMKQPEYSPACPGGSCSIQHKYNKSNMN